ncbi:MAG: hypothetical protein LBH32_10725 [Dysgonamonadaceae bacterium]|jgi:hypothetical protein|nr:hypothetical protein [Dysgonamonadaceae bacterium]
MKSISYSKNVNLKETFHSKIFGTHIYICIYMISLLCFASSSLQAQVTIGELDTPRRGALLDLRQYDPKTPGDATATKGVIFPRVDLVNPTSLEPLLNAQDSNDATRRANHKGAIVYNVTVNADFQEGLYFWNGSLWSPIGAGVTSGWELTGNAKTDSTVNFIGTTDAQPLVIKTNNQENMHISSNGNIGIKTDKPATELDINGQLTVRNVQALNSGNPKALYIDSNGLIGSQPTVSNITVAPVFFAVTTDTILPSPYNSANLTAIRNKFNLGGDQNKQIIPIKTANIEKLDNIGVTIEKDYFTIQADGVYQISASINYFMSISQNNGYIFLRTVMEKYSNNKWELLTSTRPVFNISSGATYNMVVNLPTVATELKKGDNIRFYFYRTVYNGQGMGVDVSSIFVAGISDITSKLPAYTITLNKL